MIYSVCDGRRTDKVDLRIAFVLLKRKNDRKRNALLPNVAFSLQIRQKGARLTTLSDK